MAAIGITQFMYPVVKRSWTLLGKSRDCAPSAATVNQLASTCSSEHADILNGCADMKLHGRTIYATCLARGSEGKHRRWYSPQSALREQGTRTPQDELVAWNLDTDTVTVVELKGFPGADDRSFHGLDVVEVTPHLLSIYIINHQAEKSSISKFSHKPHAATASHVSTFSNPSLVPNPHSIFAISGEDNNNAFYVSSDHTQRSGWRRALATFLQLPRGQVFYHSDIAGWKSVTNQMPGTAAIVGLKAGNTKRLFVSQSTAGAVDVFDRVITGGDMSVAEATAAEGNLTWVQRIELDFVPTGLALDGPLGKDLYISGIPRPLEFLAHHGEGFSIPGLGDTGKRSSAASLIARVNTQQLGSEFFGGSGSEDAEGKADQGYTSDPVVEELIIDEFGRLVNGSYAVLYDQGKPGAKGDLFVSSLSGQGT
ncbi:MAG: hypothetical protein M1825_004034 [Sarcosagium campestre]|nr:MAG: hypothetical protein M1825_004034 [Sarcosagium campestre]